MGTHFSTYEDSLDIIELNKNSRIILYSQNFSESSQEPPNFLAAINYIRAKINLIFGDKILYTAQDQNIYLINITSALALETVENLKTVQRSKALKLIKRRIR